MNSPERNRPLEGVRGLCALLVVFGHATYQAPLLDPGYANDAFHIDYGPQAVFVFFIISGYVIGLTSAGPATGSAIRHYVSRRLLRIVPIAWIAVLATGIFLRRNSLWEVFGNLTFLQNSLKYPFGIQIPVLYDNPPLWSLSFEMLYYAVFILIWRYALDLRVVLAVTVLAAFSDVAGAPMVFSRYAAYFVYWLCGLLVSWRTKSASSNDGSAWPASFLAAFAVWRMEPIHFLCDLGPLANVGLDRFHLDVLLGGLLIILAVTCRAPTVEFRLRSFAILLGFGVLPVKLWTGELTYVDLAAAAVLGLCLLLRGWKPSPRPLAALAPVGLVSYALYVTAFPIMRFVYRCPILPSGSVQTFFLRIVIFAILAGGTAIFLERFVQPRCVRWLKALFRLPPGSLPHTNPLVSKIS